MRRCGFCHTDKPLSEFYTHAGHKDGFSSRCISCSASYTFEWKYGITLKDYEEMYKQQDGLCLLCNRPGNFNRGKRVLHVDHDHITGKVRSLLCNKCNQGMGLFNESPELLRKVADYIEFFKQKKKTLQVVK